MLDLHVGNVIPGVVALCEDGLVAPGGPCLIVGSASDIVRPVPDPIFGFHTGVSDFVIFNQNLPPGMPNFAVMCSDTQDADPAGPLNPGCGPANVPALLMATRGFLDKPLGNLENVFERVLYTPFARPHNIHPGVDLVNP